MGRKAGLGFRPRSLCPSGGRKTLPEPEDWPEPTTRPHTPRAMHAIGVRPPAAGATSA